MRIRITLDDRARDALLRAATSEHRPIVMEAEVLLHRALGLECCDCVCHTPAQNASDRSGQQQPLAPRADNRWRLPSA